MAQLTEIKGFVMTLVETRNPLLASLFKDQKGQIDYFFNQLDFDEVETLFNRMVDSQGMVFFCGVGKSGIIAEKLAVTMVSTGTRSLYLPPTNALHGDLGIISEGDIVIFISKSGESDEVLNLIPFVRNKGAIPIAWVSKEGSRLEKACDMTVHLPIERELCPFNLAPTTSTVVQLIFGDVLAVALMRANDFTLVEYAQNHPAGQIGKRITMRVCDLMLSGSNLPLCAPDDLLVDILHELSDKRCGCILIVDQTKVVLGIFTDGDLRRAIQARGADALNTRVSELMISPFRSVGPDMLAWDAMKAMEANQKAPIMVMPVLDDEGRGVGLLKMHDIIQSGL